MTHRQQAQGGRERDPRWMGRREREREVGGWLGERKRGVGAAHHRGVGVGWAGEGERGVGVGWAGE